jgi:hypothetical protein
LTKALSSAVPYGSLSFEDIGALLWSRFCESKSKPFELEDRLLNPHKRKKILAVLFCLMIAISLGELSWECAAHPISKSELLAYKKTSLMVFVSNSLPMQSAVSEKECEACGMKVTPDDQWHFRITDGIGQVHYAECFMCALNLIKKYDTLHIETFCDWYGPNYRITIDSTEKGKQVTINPPSAIFLRTGFCEDNRVAYNQTAANALSANYSQHTSIFQRHSWYVEPTKVTVADGVSMNNNMVPRNLRFLILPLLLGPIVAVLIDVGTFLYYRVKQRRAGAGYCFGVKISWFSKV